MVKRRYKRYGYRKRGSVAKIMRNYFKAKMDYVMRVAYDSSGVKFLEWNASQKNINGLLEACSDWAPYTKIFHTFKLTGIAMEVSPNHPIANEGVFSANGSVILAILTGGDNPDSFQNVAEAKNSMVLTPTQMQRRYLSFNGGQTAWIATSDLTDLDGKVAVITNSTNVTGGLIWSVKVSFYVTFKNPN